MQKSDTPCMTHSRCVAFLALAILVQPTHLFCFNSFRRDCCRNCTLPRPRTPSPLEQPVLLEIPSELPLGASNLAKLHQCRNNTLKSPNAHGQVMDKRQQRKRTSNCPLLLVASIGGGVGLSRIRSAASNIRVSLCWNFQSNSTWFESLLCFFVERWAFFFDNTRKHSNAL